MKLRILHIPIEKRWFDMIYAGTKREEYRRVCPFWDSRLDGRIYDAIRFRNGYAAASPTFYTACPEIYKGVGKAKWGAPGNDVWIIRIGRPLDPRIFR